MTSRDFKGIPSLQEVECKGESLKPDVKLLSLKMYRVSDNAVLASLNVFENSCLTEDDFSSCFVDTRDTHQSKLRVLVDDLEAGESREYGCQVSTMTTSGDTYVHSWSTLVFRKRMSVIHCIFLPVQCEYVFRSCQCVCICLNSPVELITITLAIKKFT